MVASIIANNKLLILDSILSIPGHHKTIMIFLSSDIYRYCIAITDHTHIHRLSRKTLEGPTVKLLHVKKPSSFFKRQSTQETLDIDKPKTIYSLSFLRWHILLGMHAVGFKMPEFVSKGQRALPFLFSLIRSYTFIGILLTKPLVSKISEGIPLRIGAHYVLLSSSFVLIHQKEHCPS